MSEELPGLPGDSCEDMSTRATEVLTGESIIFKDCEEPEDLQDVVLCNFLACLSNPGWNEPVFEKHLQSLRPAAETLLPLVTVLETERKCEIVCVAMLANDVRVADGTAVPKAETMADIINALVGRRVRRKRLSKNSQCAFEESSNEASAGTRKSA